MIFVSVVFLMDQTEAVYHDFGVMAMRGLFRVQAMGIHHGDRAGRQPGHFFVLRQGRPEAEAGAAGFEFAEGLVTGDQAGSYQLITGMKKAPAGRLEAYILCSIRISNRGDAHKRRTAKLCAESGNPLYQASFDSRTGTPR